MGAINAILSPNEQGNAFDFKLSRCTFFENANL